MMNQETSISFHMGPKGSVLISIHVQTKEQEYYLDLALAFMFFQRTVVKTMGEPVMFDDFNNVYHRPGPNTRKYRRRGQGIAVFTIEFVDPRPYSRKQPLFGQILQSFAHFHDILLPGRDQPLLNSDIDILNSNHNPYLRPLGLSNSAFWSNDSVNLSLNLSM